jgi:GNAT superfamily N-acetyltransferase
MLLMPMCYPYLWSAKPVSPTTGRWRINHFSLLVSGFAINNISMDLSVVKITGEPLSASIAAQPDWWARQYPRTKAITLQPGEIEPAHTFLAAVKDGHPVGVMWYGLYPARTADSPDTFYFWGIETARDWRRQGISQMLRRAFAEMLHESRERTGVRPRLDGRAATANGRDYLKPLRS